MITATFGVVLLEPTTMCLNVPGWFTSPVVDLFLLVCLWAYARSRFTNPHDFPL